MQNFSQTSTHSTVGLPIITLSCTDVILLLINLFGEKDIHM